MSQIYCLNLERQINSSINRSSFFISALLLLQNLYKNSAFTVTASIVLY